ncbi:MAG: nucleoside monophosphate kinase [Kiritimatiellales bacterium]|nr:nucleoside monophosphate kinase [Kiritimatiellales bacterium]
MDLVFFGIQGSGKGTQAKKLAAEFGYDIFEAGGELRKIKSSGTPLGEEVASFIDEGKLVPFEIIMRVVKEAILARDVDQKILFDGIPRDGDQMNAFNDIMEEVGRDFKCIEIKLDKEEAVQRILGRAEEEGRADDADESIILRRMGTFVDKTMPVIQQYKDQDNLIEVEGQGTIEDIYARLKGALDLE